MNTDNRIRMAEAMDLLPDDFQNWSEYKDAIEKYDGEVLRILLALIPDPENDANDDYAVLEWMRGHDEFWKFQEIADRIFHWNYQIGDNYRAALKVIGESGR